MIFNDLMENFSIKSTFILVSTFNVIINVQILILTPIFQQMQLMYLAKDMVMKSLIRFIKLHMYMEYKE